jgi:hypothetical protein
MFVGEIVNGEVLQTGSNLFNQAGGVFDPSINKRVFAATGGEYDLLSLFRKVFGYRGIPYGVVKTDISKQFNKGEDYNSQIKMYAENKESSVASAMGTPIFQPLYIDDWLFPNEPLVTISGAKKLIETVSAGGDNDVIEHISLGHYEIKIQGFCVNETDDSPPEAEIMKIRQLYEARQSLEIKSPMLRLFNINLFAFKDIKFPAVEGAQAIQGYEITGRSDKYIQLTERNV